MAQRPPERIDGPWFIDEVHRSIDERIRRSTSRQSLHFDLEGLCHHLVARRILGVFFHYSGGGDGTTERFDDFDFEPGTEWEDFDSATQTWLGQVRDLLDDNAYELVSMAIGQQGGNDEPYYGGLVYLDTQRLKVYLTEYGEEDLEGDEDDEDDWEEYDGASCEV